MANEASYTDAIIIAASWVYLLKLFTTVCNTRDFSTIHSTMKTAIKIRAGLKALDQPITQTTFAARQQIIIGLTQICGIYNGQIIPITT